jgi:hypothetical protein
MAQPGQRKLKCSLIATCHRENKMNSNTSKCDKPWRLILNLLILAVLALAGSARPALIAMGAVARPPLPTAPQPGSNYAWHTFFGSDEYDNGYTLATTPDGGVIVVGIAGGWGEQQAPSCPQRRADIAVLKLDGVAQWHTLWFPDYNWG